MAAVAGSPLIPGRARVRDRISHSRRYRRFHGCQRRGKCQRRLYYSADGVLPVNCHPIATWVALCNAPVQDGENQIMQNWLGGKEDSSSTQDERRILTE